MKRSLFLCTLLLSQLAVAEVPILSFFNEQEAKDLQQLFADTSLLPYLKTLNAEIRMGMLDLSPERAAVLKKLNEAGIPVVAWLLLPKEEGYWFHSGNAKEAFERYYEIRDWAEDSGISFDGFGIDLELDYNDLELIRAKKRLKLFGKVIGRLYARKGFREAKEQYENLIETVRKDGFSIESYYAPHIRYETEKGRTALQQASGFMDLRTDKDIPMLYTSFIGNPYGTLKVMAIDENLEYVALGSTGGGIDPSMPSMTWEDLAYDLRLASRTAREIHIFCLEAAVRKGFIPRLVDFDFSVPVKEYPEQEEVVESQISKILLISAILSYPTLVLLAIILIIGAFIWMLYRLVRAIATSMNKKNPSASTS